MKQILAFVVFAVSALCICRPANATGAYDFSCGNSGIPCVYAQQDGTSQAMMAYCDNTQQVNGEVDCLVAHGSGNTVGLLAIADNNIALRAHVTGGNYAAIEARSPASNGITATNNRTDWNAAVIAALPGNSNALAYWSGGAASKPGGGPWSGNSDVRVKKDIKDFKVGLNAVLKVHPITYKYNGLADTQDDGNEFVGVIAQELEKIAPSMVQAHKRKLRPGDKEETDLKVVDPNAFTYMLINAVQEQQARIDRLERRRDPLSPYVSGLGGLGAIGLAGVFFRRRKNATSQHS